MAQIASHRLLKSADGRCNFAFVEVGIDIEDYSGPKSEWKGEKGYIHQEWRNAAQQGLVEAQAICEDKSTIVITNIVGTDVDTTPDAVHIAACMATLKLLGQTDYVEEYKSGVWKAVKR